MSVAGYIREQRQVLTRLPWHLVMLVGILASLGLAFIYSASTDFERLAQGGALSSFATKQVGFLAIGGLLAFVAGSIDYRRTQRISLLAWIAGLLLLFGCMAIGKEINGAKSWIMVGGFGIQVSEYCKVLLIVALAGLMCSVKQVDGLQAIMKYGMVAGSMLLLILMQPDFGTAMVFVPVCFAMFWTAGGRLRFILPVIVGGAVLFPALYMMDLFRDHQVKRIDTWLASLTGGDMDLSGDGYHISMSMNAIGSGGATGKGWGESILSQLDYLPERHTDFIFAVIGEEWGFLGSCLVIGLYALLVLAILHVGLRCKDQYGRLICVGVGTMFCSQFLINVGMTCGLMPVTGIPLFFVSYGGSSLMAAMLAIGLVLSVHLHPSTGKRTGY